MSTNRKILRRLFSFSLYPHYLSMFLLRATLKRKGVGLGRNVSFSGRPIVSVAEGAKISLGDNSVLCSKSERTALGVNHPVVLRAMRPGAKLSIGNRARLSGTTICAAIEIVIGDRLTAGANATIVDTDFHSLQPSERTGSGDLKKAVTKPVRIGDDVFIGASACILKGVSIGDGAVIGACSIVVRDVPPMTIVAGNPAKEIGTVTAQGPESR